jgi:hypothetical protein
MAFRVTNRAGDAADTPAYQAATMVRSSVNANTATAMPVMVNAARKGCLMELRQVSLNIVLGLMWGGQGARLPALPPPPPTQPFINNFHF